MIKQILLTCDSETASRVYWAEDARRLEGNVTANLTAQRTTPKTRQGRPGQKSQHRFPLDSLATTTAGLDSDLRSHSSGRLRRVCYRDGGRNNSLLHSGLGNHDRRQGRRRGGRGNASLYLQMLVVTAGWCSAAARRSSRAHYTVIKVQKVRNIALSRSLSYLSLSLFCFLFDAYGRTFQCPLKRLLQVFRPFPIRVGHLQWHFSRLESLSIGTRHCKMGFRGLNARLSFTKRTG